MSADNLFSPTPESPSEEVFEVLLVNRCLKLERIVSHGQATPPGQWYDQDSDEWVLLVRGSAGIRVEGQGGIRALRPGDYVHLPAHVRHRVEWTDSRERTIWLALHYQADR